MAKYTEIAAQILEQVGGKDNVIHVTHCMTRLRFNLKDQSIPKDEDIQKMPDVIGVARVGDQYQIIVGTHVGDVYDEVLALCGTGVQAAVPTAEKRTLIDRFTGYITATITPVLGVLCGCAIILAISNILSVAGLTHAGDGASILFNAMGNVVLTFFPALLGYTSAKALKMEPFVGMVIGLTLVFPGITESLAAGEPLFTLFAGTIFEQPVYQTFFGIPILFPSTGYTSTVIPVLFSTMVGAQVWKFMGSHLPQALRQMVQPMLTILITVPLAILIVGPISNILTALIMGAVTWLMGKSLVLTGVVVAFVYQPLVILGLHWPLVTIAIIEMTTTGASIVLPMVWTASFAHMAVCLAVYLATKNPKTKQVALPAVISATFCIIEPSIYGVCLPAKKRFFYCMAAGTVGAMVFTLTNTHMYAVTMGALGFPGFIDPSSGSLGGMFIAIAAVAVTMAIAFALTWFTYSEEPAET